MIAVGGEDCLFYAIVLNPTGEPIPGISAGPQEGDFLPEIKGKGHPCQAHRIYENFITVKESEIGALEEISFHDDEHFNFAFDIVDELAKKKPNKLAMLHLDRDKNERRFTFEDMSRASSRAANYFKALGIKKGDRVMLVLKRNYQFWFAVLGLHKLGAIAIPATDQLQKKDFEYRFEAVSYTHLVHPPS